MLAVFVWNSQPFRFLISLLPIHHRYIEIVIGNFSLYFQVEKEMNSNENFGNNFICA